LYGSFDDKKADDASNETVADGDDDIDVESDSDVSTNDGNSSTKNETSPTQKISPNLPTIVHPTPGKFLFKKIRDRQR
jgi:hypothetical protein